VDFSESDRVKAIRGLARDFMQQEVFPLEPALARDGFPALLPVLRQKRERARETGLWAAYVPKEWGGAGLSLGEFAHLSEELGRSPLGHYVFNCQAPDVGNVEILLEHGTPEQQERWLRPLVRGELRSCFTMTEPEFAGSNPV
jgi:acyl-CoA dehydrogenase